jgi:hypothetical protein
MRTNDMPSGRDAATAYRANLALWNAATEAERRRLLPEAWTEDARFIYPGLVCTGTEEIVAGLAGLHRQVPGIRFVQTSGIEEHNGWLRVAWRMLGGDGAVRVDGLDVVAVADDGRFRLVIGFHDPLPPLPAG